MSHRTQSAPRPRRAVLTAALVALCAGLAPSQASAAQRLETIDLPSTKGNIVLTQTRLNKTTSLQANVLLPDGYDQHPDQRYPVLYLLSGVGDNMTAWTDPKKGYIQNLLGGLNAIVVMPESGRGYFVDWWRGGTRAGSRWERYYFDEVIPTIESRYRIAAGRQNHSIGGLSMGGYGGVLYTSQFPSYFGSAYSMSGLLNLQDPKIVTILPIDIGSPFTRIWGKPDGPYASANNPFKLVDELKGSRVYLSAGNGKLDLRKPWNFSSITSGVVAELEVHQDTQRLYNKMVAAGVDATYTGHNGVHDWPYWRTVLPDLITKWNPFAPSPQPVPSENKHWTYTTMAPYGNAWSLGYTFASAPTVIETFTRDGQVLTGKGSGTVTINPGAADADASGNGTKPECSFTAKLPFEHTLPAGC